MMEILKRRIRESDLGPFELDEPKKFVAWVHKKFSIEFTVHDLRRSFITYAESLDFGAYTIKALVNHSVGSSRDVTEGYLQLSMERLRDPIQRIENYVLGYSLPAANRVTQISSKEKKRKEMLNRLSPTSEILPIEVEAFMFFPADQELQDRYKFNRTLNMKKDEIDDPNAKSLLTIGEIKSLLQGPSNTELLGMSKKALLREGPLTGDVMAAIFLIHHFKLVVEPSANKAYHFLIKRAYPGRQNRLTGRALPRSEKPIKDSWLLFRKSDPIWGALSLNRCGYRYCSSGEELINHRNLDQTLRLSATLFTFATEVGILYNSTDCYLDSYYFDNALSLSNTAPEPGLLSDALATYKKPV